MTSMFSINRFLGQASDSCHRELSTAQISSSCKEAVLQVRPGTSERGQARALALEDSRFYGVQRCSFSYLVVHVTPSFQSMLALRKRILLKDHLRSSVFSELPQPPAVQSPTLRHDFSELLVSCDGENLKTVGLSKTRLQDEIRLRSQHTKRKPRVLFTNEQVRTCTGAEIDAAYSL